jgi:Zn finger protein HypA/HybF involved in hydrogenase expression
MVAPVVNQLYCHHCYHTWVQRTDHSPKACPRCKSYDWNVEVKDDINRKLRQLKKVITGKK